jgi:hypothetical protein
VALSGQFAVMRCSDDGSQTIQQIQNLPQDDLQPPDIAILKAKNRLSADDAKLVEEAFAKVIQQSTLSDALRP